ncbi:hypothetical protein HMPREF9446_03040 [Bacteroides fluxus YIT 12057]|uniref:Uncharacterized protein n=1 Tax=Bacteroides fluxus YIT 12057 TaxID=763034 RepID=F3PWA5_9BACE|nr:hypothetical protein HMPREF9446_03040 [Bacteroides fluxus YIT 12057]
MASYQENLEYARETLHISKRALQTLRDEKAIPYTSIGDKIL